jgi:ligand-binding sensor protein
LDIYANPNQWKPLLDEVETLCGMTTTLYDPEGKAILRSSDLSNDLCRLVQAHSPARTTICSVAQQNLGRQAKVSGEPAVGECDLGMVKFVVPIFADAEMVGFIGACGAREPDVEVETFLASRTLEADEEALAAPTATVGVVTPEVIERAIQTIRLALEERQNSH